MAQTVNRLTSYFQAVGYDDLQKISASTAALSLWAGSEDGVTERIEDSLEFSMDIVRNKKRIGTLMPRSNGDPMKLIGDDAKTRVGETWENIARDFPIIRGFSSVSRDEVMKYRNPNELAITSTIGTAQSLINKAAVKLNRNVLVKQIEAVGRMELAAWESLRTGIITLDDGSTAYNFGRSSDNTDTLGTLWSNVAADGFSDLSTHGKIIDRNGKGNTRVILMAGDSLNAFLNLTTVKASADNRDISFFRAGDQAFKDLPSQAFVPRLEGYGLSYMAYYKDIKTGKQYHIFVYPDEYQNSSDVWTPYYPAGKVLMFDPDIRLDRFFGPGLRFDYKTQEEQMIERMLGVQSFVDSQSRESGAIESWMFHHDVLPNQQKTAFGVETYTSPLYECTEVDSAGELTVL
jgi:hypothetical protein